MLKVAADPNVVSSLSYEEMRLLLLDPSPPEWVFVEAARRKHNKKLLALLFARAEVDKLVLVSALSSETTLLDRYQHHINVYKGDVGLSSVLKTVVPEGVGQPTLRSRLERLLALHLSTLCLGYLKFKDKEAQHYQHFRLNSLSEHTISDQLFIKDLPRFYQPLARFVLLGDFLHYLTCKQSLFIAEVGKLTLLAKAALALNTNQPLELFLNDGDVRVRRAAQERQSWNAN